MSYRQRKKVILRYRSFLSAVLITIIVGGASVVCAWDHPSHMITAAIAFEEIERLRPELMERIGFMLMKHPDPAPFWVAVISSALAQPLKKMGMEMSKHRIIIATSLFMIHSSSL